MRRRNRRKWQVAGVALVCVIITAPRMRTFLVHYRNLQRYKAEIIRLERENEILAEKIREIKQDPFYTEKLLRDNFGYIKEGEYVYRIGQ